MPLPLPSWLMPAASVAKTRMRPSDAPKTYQKPAKKQKPVPSTDSQTGSSLRQAFGPPDRHDRSDGAVKAMHATLHRPEALHASVVSISPGPKSSSSQMGGTQDRMTHNSVPVELHLSADTAMQHFGEGASDRARMNGACQKAYAGVW